jgi:predicted GNAT superfamily acetyltransferase
MTGAHAAEVLRINAGSRPGVAPLDPVELQRLQSLSDLHRVANAAASGAGLAGYVLAFDRAAAYDGEEFLALRKLLPGPFLYIDQVAVSVDHRRCGVAVALYRSLEASAATSGVLCCEVNLQPPNPASSAFHRAAGFEVVATMLTADGREVEFMKKAVVAR